MARWPHLRSRGAAKGPQGRGPSVPSQMGCMQGTVVAETRGNSELSVNRQSRASPRNQGSQLVVSCSLGISILLSSFPSVHTVWGALTAILCVTVVTQPKGHGPQSQVPLRPDLEKLQFSVIRESWLCI